MCRNTQTKKNILRPPSLIIHSCHLSINVWGLYGSTFTIELVLDLWRPWSRLRSVLLR